MKTLDIEALLELHRSVFGDARMEDDTDEDDDTDAAADDESTDDGKGDDKDKDDKGTDDDKPLGPKGEKALAAEKERRRQAQQDLREWKALGKSPADIKKLLDAGKDDNKPDADQIREQARTEARTEVLRERVFDKIEAKAGAKFNLDPEDVAALLLRRHDVNDFLDGDKVDAEAISDALDELLEKKPNLGAVQDGKRFKGKADGGTRKESQPAQLTEADVDRLYAEKKYAEIEKARTEGRLNDYLGIKAS